MPCWKKQFLLLIKMACFTTIFYFNFSVAHCLLQEVMGMFMMVLSVLIIILSCMDIIVLNQERHNFNLRPEGLCDIVFTIKLKWTRFSIFVKIFINFIILIWPWGIFWLFRYKWNSIWTANLHNWTSWLLWSWIHLQLPFYDAIQS